MRDITNIVEIERWDSNHKNINVFSDLKEISRFFNNC